MPGSLGLGGCRAVAADFFYPESVVARQHAKAAIVVHEDDRAVRRKGDVRPRGPPFPADGVVVASGGAGAKGPGPRPPILGRDSAG